MKKIKLDNHELRIVIYSLNEVRNKLIAEGEYPDLVDDVLEKYIDVLNK